MSMKFSKGQPANKPSDSSAAPTDASKKPTLARRIWREWCLPFAVVILVLSTFRSAVADWNDVPTGSMRPTIIEGDRIFVNKLAYDLRVPFTNWRLAEWASPQRGDVVICFSPENGVRLVKRVVGLPGDRIELVNNRLWINGKAASYEKLDPDIINQVALADQRGHYFVGERIDQTVHPVMLTPSIRSKRNYGPVTVPQGEFFIMGDNRDNSRDSRVIGFVKRRMIVGKVPLVVLSLDRDNYYAPRWDRFFRTLP